MIQVKSVQITQLQKTELFMEEKLNAALKGRSFKYATQSYNQGNKKIVYMLTVDSAEIKGDEEEKKEIKSQVKAKVFKSNKIDDVEKKMNEFYKKNDVKLRLMTMTYSGNSAYGTLFFE